MIARCGLAIAIIPRWDLSKEVIFFTGWGMYLIFEI
jgi:hypothetical protein